MQKLILPLLLCLSLMGCSFLPRFTFEKPGTTAQQTERNTHVVKCKGEYKLNDVGEMVYCSSGYYVSEQSTSIKDRKYTITERIANFFRALTGWGLVIVLLLIVFVPGFVGWFVGNVFNGANKALEATIRGIQKAKSNGINLPPEERVKYQQMVVEFLSTISAEHGQNPEVVKLIDKIRTNLKITEGL